MRLLLLFFSLIFSTILLQNTATAEKSTDLEPSNAPLDLSALKPENAGCKSIVTANTICQHKLTEPSLWWAKEQVENRLLDNWIVYKANGSEKPRVDLIVNQQIWSILDYLERYDFINRLGTTASNYGYNIRVFNYEEEQLGSYTCNFETSPKPKCNIKMPLQRRIGVQRLPINNQQPTININP